RRAALHEFTRSSSAGRGPKSGPRAISSFGPDAALALRNSPFLALAAPAEGCPTRGSDPTVRSGKRRHATFGPCSRSGRYARSWPGVSFVESQPNQPWGQTLGDNFMFARSLPFTVGLGVALGYARAYWPRKEESGRRFARSSVWLHWLATL